MNPESWFLPMLASFLTFVKLIATQIILMLLLFERIEIATQQVYNHDIVFYEFARDFQNYIFIVGKEYRKPV